VRFIAREVGRHGRPRGGWGNDCEVCCGIGLGDGSGADTLCRHDAGTFQHGKELVDRQIHECIQFSRGQRISTRSILAVVLNAKCKRISICNK
jgi:hypothetical protein